MRPAGNPLDLNNLPEEYGKQALEESSTTTAASTETIRFKKKKSGAKEDAGKVYECRFCSLKFCKSQALGGHMNRHRQERETETLNRARQLVFSNEAHAGAGAGAHIGYRDLNVGGSVGTPQGFQQLRPVYPRLPTQQASPQPTIQPYIYPSSSRHPIPFPSSYPVPPPPHPSFGEYFIGHVLPSSTQRPPPHHQSYGPDSSSPCFGAPLSSSRGFPVDGVRAPAVTRDGSGNQVEGRNWNHTSSPSDPIQDEDHI